MKKVYLDNLPKRGELIDWKNSVCHRVKFVYGNIEGEIKIADYKDGYLTLIYKEKNSFSNNWKSSKMLSWRIVGSDFETI